MAPIRRYLRITKYSVLECRIYVDGNPMLAESWLLRKRDPALPRIFKAIQHKVLPNLREENSRAKTKGKGKSKAIKDVVIEDDFEVSIYLKDQPSRHSILTKQKNFSDKPRLKSNSTKLTGWLNTGTNEAPIDVDEDDVVIPAEDEEDEDDVMALLNIPEAPAGLGEKQPGTTPSDALFVHSSDSDEDLFQTQAEPPPSAQQSRGSHDVLQKSDDDEGVSDDKKKLGLQTNYEGFAIYGRILCLVVKRRGGPAAPKGNSQAMMESWVSTQIAQELGIDQEG